jgi:hypothetical protein
MVIRFTNLAEETSTAMARKTPRSLTLVLLLLVVLLSFVGKYFGWIHTAVAYSAAVL